MGFSRHLGTKLAIAASLFIGQAGLMAGTAYAGFDWTPPPQQKAETAAPSADTSSVSIVQDGPLTPDPDAVLQEKAQPVPVENVQVQPLIDSPVDMPADRPAEHPTSLVSSGDEVMYARMPSSVPDSTPVPAPAPVSAPEFQPSPALESPAPMDSVTASTEPVLEGFGKNISLPLALREIVPAQYAYAFSDGAIAGTKISWRGGKPWNVVLDDALADHHLGHALVNNTVYIYDLQAPANFGSEKTGEKTGGAMSETSQENSLDAADASADTTDIASIAAPVSAPVAASTGTHTMPVINVNALKEWKARPGYTLRNVIEEWAQAAQVEVEWQSPYDYPIHNAFQYKGRFDEALASLLSQYSKETPRPRGRLYPNLPTGPSVLVVN